MIQSDHPSRQRAELVMQFLDQARQVHSQRRYARSSTATAAQCSETRRRTRSPSQRADQGRRARAQVSPRSAALASAR